ncbi:MAG: phosphoglycerate kinase [Patescibacteria group bacterium]|nr:phosphoglycerate kinase [Patescibacteria group bacterium]
MRIKSIRNIKNLAGKIILLRADLNVPIKSGRIKDDFKIVAALPTIRYLLRHNCRVIVATHLGKGDKADSVKPLADRLGRLLGKKTRLVKNYLGEAAIAEIKKIREKEVIVLENLRWQKGEGKNDKKFARSLAALADIYVNDAFAVSHRNHASLAVIKKYLPAYAGLLLEKEVLNLHKILAPKPPLISIIGGAKIQTKIALIKKLAKKSYRVLIGGALANNFIAAHGFKIGKSLADKASIKIAAELARKYKNIILPVDVLVAKKINSASYKVKPVNQVEKDDIILDIGPRTVKLFISFIKKANTITWNGPMGYFENKHFKHGTLAIARFVATRSTGQAFGAVGGGETIEALKMTKMENYIDWVSTGGGAMLAFLGGEKMPGLKGIVK